MIPRAMAISRWSQLSSYGVTLLLREAPSAMMIYICPLMICNLDRVSKANAEPIQSQPPRKLGTHLTHNTFLFPTNRLSLEDITFSAVLKGPIEYLWDPKARHSSKYSSVVRLFETIVNHPAIKNVFGEVEYAEPKAKNPLDDLPKSNFNLEDRKRAYSNMDSTRGDAGSLKWFYENGLTSSTTTSSNQIGGFFNRLEASRKYLFGSVGVCGETNNSVISGALILRGLDYKKSDLKNFEEEAFFEGELAWDLEVNGKKWASGKNVYFK
ncbi:hypothetical protein FRC12_009661 [Ceratobasidium sp. 428]|nr:hypothetical protein FRC12_009661 [Ceratobasidium sp. 428]